MAVLAKLDTPVMQILARIALPVLVVNTRVPTQMATVPPVTRTVLAVLFKPEIVPQLAYVTLDTEAPMV
jgi:hypothetical protein